MTKINYMGSEATQFKKGTGGRPKGTVNKINQGVREMLKAFTERNHHKFLKSLETLSPKDFAIFYLKACELIMPKKVESEMVVTNTPAIDYSKYSDAELKNLQSLLLKGANDQEEIDYMEELVIQKAEDIKEPVRLTEEMLVPETKPVYAPIHRIVPSSVMGPRE